ncbi:hypothetical protein [Allorhizocola rhizosphaerae]|uniref:hypothetical protein n=1 Tax=Allorhizocola rhizosphaerae TaxID=1872709 RepID=UPI0013C2A416|nr:hypothetical protein [Allorhizocola rhizosphaerae]
MRLVERMSDRMLSLFVPRATAAAATTQACYDVHYCQSCSNEHGVLLKKFCWAQYCNGSYVNGGCGRCGYC